MKFSKIAAALVGFVAGVVTAPLAAIAWPFAFAAFLYNEHEGFK